MLARRGAHIKKTRGVTIIELLIVIAVIGILTAIGAPNLRRDRPQVREASRIIAADLRRARSEAIRLNAPVVLKFNVPNSSYTLGVADDFEDDHADDLGELNLNATRNLAADFPLSRIANVTFAGDEVRFNPRGLPRNASGNPVDGIIRIASRQDANYIIEVELEPQGRIQTRVVN